MAAPGTASYVGANGTDYTARDGVFYGDSPTRFGNIRDGLSNRIAVGERPPSADNWYAWWHAGAGQLLDGLPSGSPDMLLGCAS